MNKEVKEEKLIRLKRLSERLDNTFTIPGTKYKIGIEALIGAVPIIGDLIGGILASYIMYSGMKMGAPPRIIARMAVNIAIDFAIGSIPIIGDLFDLVWKANKKNVELIEDATLDDKEEQKLNYLIITALILVLLGILLLILTMFS
jgi:hypothetical protein|tara:strand:- start:169 stop:606 length:438 start_codon:yes stop_codon:yes gene_type:complete